MSTYGNPKKPSPAPAGKVPSPGQMGKAMNSRVQSKAPARKSAGRGR